MRTWETRFQVYGSMPELPVPTVVVEEIQDNPSYRLLGRNRRLDKGSQLVYTLSGEGRFSAGAREFVLKPGTAFLAQHCDERTAYYYPEGGREPWVFLWMAFYGGFSAEVVNSIVARHGYIYELPRDKGIISQMEAFKGLKGSIVDLSPLAGAGLVMDLLCGLDLHISRRMGGSTVSAIHKAQTMLMKRISEGVGVQDISAELSMSREHFSRVFRKHAGVTPEFYIRRERIRLSCGLLKETQLDSKEIAARAGYQSPASFCRAFKKILKMTPEQFRKLGHSPGWV